MSAAYVLVLYYSRGGATADNTMKATARTTGDRYKQKGHQVIQLTGLKLGKGRQVKATTAHKNSEQP